MESQAPKYYMVLATYGEYSTPDNNWIVAIYPDKNKAKQHAKLANETASKINQTDIDRDFAGQDIDQKARLEFPYDKRISSENIPFTSHLPDYKVVEAPFVLHVDQYIELVSQK